MSSTCRGHNNFGISINNESIQSRGQQQVALGAPPDGWVKHVLRFRQFSMRGLAKARAEWRLVCTSLNLRRMTVLMPA